MIQELQKCAAAPAAADRQPFVCNHQKVTAPAASPEALMQALRQKFRKTFWMACNDPYREGEKMIMIAAEPLAGIEVHNTHSGATFIKDRLSRFTFQRSEDLMQYVDAWMAAVKPAGTAACPYNGLLGYCSYNAVQLSEDIRLMQYAGFTEEFPLLQFQLYRYLFIFRKDTGDIHLVHHRLGNEPGRLEQMKAWLQTGPAGAPAPFRADAAVASDLTDAEFIGQVKKAQEHCRKGDVFQVVLSRKFSRSYQGDPWTFFTALQALNRSPYMFFLDEGDFQIAGTSPETHFMVTRGEGCINPIAGTYQRVPSAEQERRSVDRLLNDPKENAEHIMLVDLARNDLNKIASRVHVAQFRTIEKYAHVMHIVSRVKGRLHQGYRPFRSVMDVFPAGTLSGAPKYRAMEIIDDLEGSSRSFYGGLLGWIGFNGDINTCILIRSALFQHNRMTYRAGAGVVESSVPELELEEVNNKLRSITTVLDRLAAQ